MTVTILKGDCREVLRTLPDESVHCVVTSPPYWGLRDYGVTGQIGFEVSPEAFVDEMVSVFREVRRVLRSDGTCWLNLGDRYMGGGRGGGAENCKQRTNVGSLDAAPNQRVVGYKQKDLVGAPWLVAFALRADGWYLRQDIIWSKPNPMPESVRDRCTKAHEYLFLLSKSERYHYDQAAIAETAINAGKVIGYDGSQKNCETAGDPRFATRITSDRTVGDTRNRRSVWEIATQPYAEAHFATFPPGLIEPCILAGCPKGGTVLDPFGGAGTTGLVADRLGRDAILIELNPEYAAMAERRILGDAGMFAEVLT